ncbi:hypothetical protein [Aurantimonas sp. Leaf443]|uniref:hypothetical protein n=1 Tax=Aurantimonas sp. Leaf443 TaxID=1736378 RepID=UPI0006FD5839|nr:hypothetical protein [Aurantimonas sp. Leaf443]KQT86143.1 hypothetical protein ASG48_06075 [Aurantimonas sp. Leaf443]
MSLADHPTSPFDGPALRRLGRGLREALTPRLMRAVSIGLFCAMVLLSAATAILKPEYNWDMGPYIAVSLEDRIADPVALHEAAWSGIRAAAPAGQWYTLSAGNPYNADLWANPRHFFSQLTMYRVKIGYTQAIRLLDHVVSPVMATILIGALSALGVGAIVLYWSVRGGFAESAALFLPVLVLAGYFNMALLATPDLFMAVFGLAGVYLVVHNRPWASVPFLLAMYLVRPDGIIFLFALLLSAIAFGYARLPMLLAFVAALLLYGPIAHAAGHPGWWPHFYFSNIQLQNDMTGFAPAFSVLDYLRGVARGLSVALRLNNWPMLMLLLAGGWVLLALNGLAPSRRGTMMLVALVLCFLGKFATFPLPDDRVYFLFVAAFAMVLFEAWKPRLDYRGTAASIA